MLSLFFIIIIIFMMCRFNEYAGFMWSNCHAGVVRFLLDGCYGRWFVYFKQRTASCWPLRAGGTCTHSAENEFRWHEYRSALSVDCWSIRSGKYPDAVTRACAVRMIARFVLLICKLSPGVVTLQHFLPKVSVMGPWDLPILVTGLEGVCPTISVKNLGEVIQNYHL